MNIKELKKLIADMPDDAPVLLSVSDHNYKEAWYRDMRAYNAWKTAYGARHG